MASEPVAGDNSVRELSPGLFHLEFFRSENVTAEKCVPLIPPLEAACKRGPIGLVATLPNDLRLMHPGMAPYWIGVLLDRVTITAVGVITTSVAIKVVLKSVDMAMGLRSKPIRAAPFTSLRDAVAWVTPQVPPRAL